MNKQRRGILSINGVLTINEQTKKKHQFICKLEFNYKIRGTQRDKLSKILEISISAFLDCFRTF